jgi:hypothetical protein
VPPAQNVVAPDAVTVAVGAALTVMDADVVVVHPLAVTLYEIVAEPADTPVTTPLALTSATVASLVDQTPPVVELAKTVVDPTHTLDAPVIAATTGNGLIVALNVNVFPTHVPLVGVTV